ncbi:MAG: hypothetical protein O3A42_13075 [Actinobacteria bacterium]|nr:hypothetical protein [Actinomycetota bacterium]
MSDYYELTIVCDDPRHARGKVATIEAVTRLKGHWLARNVERSAVEEFRRPDESWGSARWRRIGSDYGQNRRRYACKLCGTTLVLTESAMAAVLDVVAAQGVSRTTLAQLTVLASTAT